MSRSVRNFILAGWMAGFAVLATPRAASAYTCDEEANTCTHEYGSMSYGSPYGCVTVCQDNVCQSQCAGSDFTCSFAGHPEWNWGGSCSTPYTF